jgi:hypothetical protein
MDRSWRLIIGLPFVFAACNQPFEPQGPVSNKLAVYSILNAQSDTQYVRLGTTYDTPPGPEIRDALVEIVGDGRRVRFADTTVQWTDANGNVVPINIYVAYNFEVKKGIQYSLQASTPSGLKASSSTTVLEPPVFDLQDPTVLERLTGFPITLEAAFRTPAGAYAMHFYVEYYVLIEGGWELRRDEVPAQSYIDQTGQEVLIYPSLTLVAEGSFGTILIQYDPELYQQTRARILTKYAGNPLIILRAVFVLTQIDDVLYSYYYINNGPIDQSTIRVDQPDYTNIANGFGVFGCTTSTTMMYPLKH